MMLPAVPDLTFPERKSELDKVRISLCALDDDRDIALSLARDLLTDYERSRAGRYHFDRDRDRFIRGRGRLRQILGSETGVHPRQVALEEGVFGKPALAKGGAHFNLSNSNAIAAIAVSEKGPVGIDIEWLDRSITIDALAQTCFSEEEISVLNSVQGEERNRRFFEFWTAKEARMKLTGEGMSLPPLSIRLKMKDGLPVGCAAPATPGVVLRFPLLGVPDLVCCYAVQEVS